MRRCLIPALVSYFLSVRCWSSPRDYRHDLGTVNKSTGALSATPTMTVTNTTVMR